MALFVGCTGHIPAADGFSETPEVDGGSPPQSEELPLSPGAWQSFDADERKRFMAQVVMPAMHPLFIELDPERFATFSCASCHGQGAGDGSFAMPSSDVPALNGPPAEHDQDLQRVTELMRSSIKPKMAELLGESELRCSNCHPSAR